jgi:hypothetical protein
LLNAFQSACFNKTPYNNSIWENFMRIGHVFKINRLRLAGLSICTLAAFAGGQAQPARAQNAADPNAAAIAALQTYETPDHTASVRLPPNWQVVATGVGFVQARGPNGEMALFGVMIPARDGDSTVLGQRGITQPYATDPTQKFLASVNWIRQHNGKPAVQARFYSSSPIQAPPAFGTCSKMTAVLNGAVAVETDFCSLPKDNAGNYRNFFKVVGLPVQAAMQERTLMEAILASYRLNMKAVQAKRAAANTQAPPQGSAASIISMQNSLMANQLMTEEANAINQETINAEEGSDNSFNNFDHGVLRGETPVYGQGDPQPLFWVGGN